MVHRRLVGLLTCLVLALSLLACARGGPGGTNTNTNTNVNTNDNQNTNVAPVQGHPAQATVPGGTVMQSSGYRLILTTGESPGGSGTTESSSYKAQGGVVGATQ